MEINEKSTKDNPLEPTFINPDESKKKDSDSDSNTTGEEVDNAPPSVSFFSLFRFASTSDKIMLTIAFLSSIATGAVAPLNTIVFSELAQAMIMYALKGVPEAPIQVPDDFDLMDEVFKFAMRNVGLGAILLVFSYLSTMLSNYAAHNQIFTIRRKFLDAALNQDIAYYDVNESGDFASRMTDDLIKLEDGIGEKAPTCFHYWVSFAGCIIMAFVRGWELTLICLASFPVILIAVGTVGVVSSRLSKKESLAYGLAGAVAEEVLGGIRTVVAFGGQEKEVERFKTKLIDAKNINIKRSLFTGIGLGILYFCIYSTYALSFWYGIGLVLDNPTEYPINKMVAVFFGVLMGTMNFGMSTPFIEIFGVAKGAGAKIFSVIDNVPIIDPRLDKGVKPAECEGNITFRNVVFDYPSRPQVKILQGLDLTIKNGQTVAIVGGSGCGKSTCIQLIQRFYDPLDGAVLLDNNDLRDISVTWLRKNIGVVGQEPVLFNTTIGENIRYGFEGATQKDIEDAAKKSNAHDFIKILPKGYDTLVGERGTQLSGGQKQRIAIARALVRNPKILLLDEATSALDNTSEAKVQAALDKAGEGRTTIIVAHRLSTIRTANMIVALHEGKVAELGTHDELMNIKGHYYNLVMAQTSPTGQKDEGNANKFERTISTVSAAVSEQDEDKILPPEYNADDEEEDDKEPKNLPFWRIALLNSPEWPFMTVACICSIIMGCAMPVFSVLFGEILGSFTSNDPDEIRETTNFFCIIFVVAGVITGFATFLSIFNFGIAGEKMTMRLRYLAFEAMLSQEMGWFDDKSNATGALCARLSGEASAVQGATGQRIGTILQSIATLTLAIALSLYFEWRLGLVAMCFMPFTLATTILHRTVAVSENFGSSKAMENSTKLAVDVISNIRTVASLGREQMFVGKFVDALEPAMLKAKRNTHFRGLVYGVARSIIFFAFAGSMYYGGYLIVEKDVEFKNVLRVSQALILATISVANALTFAPNLQKGVQSASRIIHLLSRKPKVVDPADPICGSFDAIGNVKYKDIDFAYPTRPYLRILQNMQLEISSGKTIALVGSSGCGKSTCIQLLERFYDPLNGEVILDDKPINKIKMANLRSNLGIVSQEPILFDRTIGENIAYGDNSREVTQQEIIEAAKQANIHNFISSLPLGYETRLGTKGAQLSGGQKQRVAIARALLRNPRVLLLDEATSALDTESEKVVQEALDKAKLGRTCITIAHRLSTIQDADLICVFNEGKVGESGTHQELMKLKGIYYRLQTQSQRAI